MLEQMLHYLQEEPWSILTPTNPIIDEGSIPLNDKLTKMLSEVRDLFLKKKFKLN